MTSPKRFLNELPECWQERLQKRLQAAKKDGEESPLELTAHNFRGDQSVRLHFPDGSYALFQYAFCLTDESLNEAAVFTEHCGYHIFPLYGLTIETLRTVCEDA